MSDTTHLALTYLEAAQAQKHVTVNEALARIDALVHLAVISRTLATPPATPSEGDRYFVAASPTGAWVGQIDKIAMWLAGQWVFASPREGWRMWVNAEDALFVFDGTAWVATGGGGGATPTVLQNMQLLGVNATADATNKLTVSSSATLFNHAGNGHQIKLNKNAAADTASLLWQTGFSGRAEIGITGDDALRIKVSATGGTFNDVLVADAGNNHLRLPIGFVLGAQAAPPTPVDGQVWFDTATGRFTLREQGATKLLTAAGSSGSSAPPYKDICARHLISF
jgi:hypothetical protein